LDLLPEKTEVWASEILFRVQHSKSEKGNNPLRKCVVETKKLLYTANEPKVLTCLDREGFDQQKDSIALPVATIGRTAEIKGAGVVVYIPKKGERHVQ